MHRPVALTPVVLLLTVPVPLARADALDAAASSLAFNADEARTTLIAQDAPAHSAGAPVKTYKPYGAPGQWWIGLGAGVPPGQTEREFALDTRLTLTTSTFLVENFEFLMDWSLWG